MFEYVYKHILILIVMIIYGQWILVLINYIVSLSTNNNKKIILISFDNFYF